MAGGKRSKNPKKTLGRLLHYIRDGYAVQFGVVLVCILISAVVNVAGSMFLRVLIDDYIAPLLLEAAPVFTGLIHAILLMGLIYLTGIVSTFLYNWLMVAISQGILKKVRDEMFGRMQTLPIRYFDTHTHGDLMSHFTNDTDTLQQMLSQSVPQMFSSIMTIIAVFIAMLATNVWLTLFVLAGVAVMLVVVKRIGGQSAKYFLEQQTSLGKVNGYIEEMINGQKVVKVFCHEDKCKEQFDALNDELRENAKNANTFANILMPIMMNIGNLLYVLVAVVGGTLALSGVVGSSITIGVIASFLQLTKSFTQPVTQISQQFNSIVMALAGAERIFELMDEAPETDDGYVTLVNAKYDKNGELVETPEKTNIWAWKHPHEDGTTTYQQVRGDVRFFDVDFGYNPEKIVLHDITLYAEPGQKVAFVGATGAGKTTITNLINRFYDLADGKIRYDGININKIKKADLRRSLGIVLQDTNLFTGTIRDNIRYGNLEATDQEIEAAAQLAGADDFIRRLPDGYDTVIDGDGGSLSQGQRQLLSIARAAVADPPVMILDEATSSIDTRTESIVQAGMDGLMYGRTVFVIAHRLSTVQNADVIMVLELGHIIERGNHAQLIAERGKYYQLYTGAFELE
ncbi:ABC transporter ATP-binding protein [Intestinibacillus sp. NTUH-41-i26]|uniref:ABC transporter ATP-binding protein/permease n=2 Tax=Eubacteriales TaxID=186802 RepID=A0ABT2U454_9FIRM|nr:MULTISPECIES: ABC transporter ATP-binding protein [Butyricicoccaceae]MCU6788846.1 ABC transporter ATP-binding protein/permease [Agathobaculum ammoniilyticum]WOC76928.1 ABC transporter ATP-binding protein [Intestinibacillus sp. NTUH-41-i26]